LYFKYLIAKFKLFRLLKYFKTTVFLKLATYQQCVNNVEKSIKLYVGKKIMPSKNLRYGTKKSPAWRGFKIY